MCQEMVKLDQEGKQKGTKKLNLKFIILTCSHHRSARPTICFVKSQTLGLHRDISFLVNTDFTCLWKKSKLALFNLKWGIRYGIYADWINFPGKKLIASGCVGAFWSDLLPQQILKKNETFLFNCLCLPLSTRDTEDLLRDKDLGSFLIRLSDKAFGFILSYKWGIVQSCHCWAFVAFSRLTLWIWLASADDVLLLPRGYDRCRHFVITQNQDGQFVIAGDYQTYASLTELIEHYKASPIQPFGEYLTSSCHQVGEWGVSVVTLVKIGSVFCQLWMNFEAYSRLYFWKTAIE